MTRLSFAAAIAAALVLGAAAPVSAQQAGVSAAVRGQVSLARASQNIVGQQVKSGDPIFLGDAITSGKDSGLQIMLLDETIFSIGPNSEISIDEFVYDPTTGAGKLTASVAKGIFRFITGRIARKNPKDMTVRLPTATIGIRGTIVAGAVRAAPGRDPRVDAVFNGLKGVASNAGAARDFVVLLGPGNENNTNDKGGAFVLTPRRGDLAARGRNAGTGLAQIENETPKERLDRQFREAAGPFPEVFVSRTGFGIVSFGGPGGNGLSDPFGVPPGVSQGLTNNLGAQPPGGPTGKSSDANARNASGAQDANALSGNPLAETALETAARFLIGAVQDDQGNIQDPSAGSGGNQFSFQDLTKINTGIASLSGGSLNIGNVFTVGSFFFTLNFGNNQFTFDLSNISGGGLSSDQIGCFSSCSINYGGFSGAAIFNDSQANFIRSSGCDDCSVNIAVVNASSANGALLNVNLSHVDAPGGPASATTQVNLPPQ